MVSGRVSVIIPCYNNEQYVGAAIESALNQTYDDIEVIVVDDGSTDDSLNVIQKYDSSITWRSQENQGAPVARNRGLSLATGAFVKFLDADDVLTKQCLETQHSFIHRSCSHHEIPFGDIATIDDQGNFLDRKSYERFVTEPYISGSDLLKQNIPTPAPLHRARHLREVGGFDEDNLRAQEYDLHLKLWANGYEFRYDDCLCSLVRRHSSPTKITRQNILRQHPMYAYRTLERRIDRISTRTGTPLPKPARQFFAQELWGFGRRLLRLGCREKALQYFKRARSLNAECPVNGSTSYRHLVSVLGPTLAEYIGLARSHLLSVFSGYTMIHD
jgi:glycosyltransferase involved in cell wall biosynthesis